MPMTITIIEIIVVFPTFSQYASPNVTATDPRTKITIISEKILIIFINS